MSLEIPEYAFHLAEDLDVLDDDGTHGGVLRLEADMIPLFVECLYGGLTFEAVNHGDHDISVPH